MPPAAMPTMPPVLIPEEEGAAEAVGEAEVAVNVRTADWGKLLNVEGVGTEVISFEVGVSTI